MYMYVCMFAHIHTHMRSHMHMHITGPAPCDSSTAPSSPPSPAAPPTSRRRKQGACLEHQWPPPPTQMRHRDMTTTATTTTTTAPYSKPHDLHPDSCRARSCGSGLDATHNKHTWRREKTETHAGDTCHPTANATVSMSKQADHQLANL